MHLGFIEKCKGIDSVGGLALPAGICDQRNVALGCHYGKRQRSEEVMGEIIAHEIGHLLGM